MLQALLSRVKSMSFSQYGEDLMLAVSLFPGRRGVYVDVGAHHPWRESNTYKLYLRGWRGLTIEPNPAAAKAFRASRPRDVHAVEGVAHDSQDLTYFEFRDSKVNTFSRDQAEGWIGRGSPLLGTKTIPCRPLHAIIESHLPNTPVDLLSIDCEGFDLVALQTFDFGRLRPTAILVEDYEAFNRLKDGAGSSAIEGLLRGLEYAPIGQVMFSTLYVDQAAMMARQRAAFDLPATQF